MNKTSTFKSFSLLTILTVFEKIIAFVFQAVLAALLGTGVMTDAYFSAAELFGVLEVTAISSLTVVALNRYSEYLSREGEKEGFSFLSNLLSFYMPFLAILSAVIFVFADPVSYMVAPGFSADAHGVLVLCIRVMATIPVIECVTAIGLAVLRQKRRFALTSLKSLFISVAGIVFVVIFSKTKVNSAVTLSVAYMVSMLLFCILTMVYTAKYGKLRLVKPTVNAEIRATVRMILPLIVSYGITRTTMMIGKIISSFLGNGAVSQLTYAHNLYAVVSAIFITNLSTILLTDFNELVSQKKNFAVVQKIRSVMPAMTMVLIPITVVSIVCGKDIVRIVYERGSFSNNDTVLVANVLAVYALNFIPAMIQSIYNQILYANNDTKTPMWIAIVSIVVNFSVSMLLINVIGLPGVAGGTMVASILCRIAIKRYFPKFNGCYSLRFLGCSTVATIVCVIAALLVKTLHLSAFFAFVVTTLACFTAFLITLLMLKEKCAIDFLETLTKLFKKMMKRKA